jgi:hypothetical protein
MRRLLTIHPDSVPPAAIAIEVDISRPRPGLLVLDYAVSGAVAGLYLPPAAEPRRADELWRRTCFEAFLRPSPGEAYVEFNVSPSGAWAAYRFGGYRTGMTVADEIEVPRIAMRQADDRFELRVSWHLGALPLLSGDASWRLGASAVIEAADGARSYWALAHPPGKPDFHHADGFASQLPPPEPA